MLSFSSRSQELNSSPEPDSASRFITSSAPGLSLFESSAEPGSSLLFALDISIPATTTPSSYLPAASISDMESAQSALYAAATADDFPSNAKTSYCADGKTYPATSMKANVSDIIFLIVCLSFMINLFGNLYPNSNFDTGILIAYSAAAIIAYEDKLSG